MLAVIAGKADGIGLMLKDGETGAGDLDHVRDVNTGDLLDWAQRLCVEADTLGLYHEVTVSGQGLRFIGLAQGNELHRKFTFDRKSGAGVELYRKCARYITISGLQEGECTELGPIDAYLDMLMARYEQAPAKNIFDFNDAGPQIDYRDIIENGAPEGERSEPFQKIVWHFARLGWTEEEITAEFEKYPNGIGAKYAGRLLAEVKRSYGKWRRKQQSAATGGAGTTGATGGASGGTGTTGTATSGAPWPQIYVKAGELPRILDEADAALAVLVDLGYELYEHGERLVQAHQSTLRACGGREYRRWKLDEVSTPTMIVLLSCAARWLRYDNRRQGWAQVDPPALIAEAYLHRRQWRLPKIAGISNTPFLRADGTLCEREGFDPASGWLCKWNGVQFPPVPAKPDKDDALRALETLCQPIAEFPFVAPVDKSVSLSATLTALARRSLDFAPIHAYTARTYGTGKGLLCDVSVAIASGRPAAPLSQSRHEEETTKALNAALIEGDAFVSLDNCAYTLEGGTILTIAVRQPLLKVRVLGISHNVEIPNSAMFFANGNNLQIAADLTRRTLLCHLDANMERPETREFEDDQLLDTVIANRGPLVTAGLTILRAWQLARPKVPPLELEPLDFVAWSQTVREALVWLGCADPGESMRQLRQGDPQRAELLAVLTQWYALFGERPVMVREVIEAAFVRIVSNPDFQNSLLAVAEAKRGGVSSDRLGRWLARNEGAIGNSLRLKRVGISSLTVPLWKVSPA